jgi:hypothetical protein
MVVIYQDDGTWVAYPENYQVKPNDDKWVKAYFTFEYCDRCKKWHVKGPCNA